MKRFLLLLTTFAVLAQQPSEDDYQPTGIPLIDRWTGKPTLWIQRGNLKDAFTYARDTKVSLRGLSFTNLVIEDANLNDLTFEGCDFTGTTLRRVSGNWLSLKGSKIDGLSIEDSDAVGLDLSDTTGEGVSINAKVPGLKLTNAKLPKLNLAGAKARDANLAGAEVHELVVAPSTDIADAVITDSTTSDVKAEIETKAEADKVEREKEKPKLEVEEPVLEEGVDIGKDKTKNIAKP